MKGLIVRTRGTHLILAREEQDEPDQPPVDSNRVRLSWLGSNTFGLSVCNWKGRWKKNHFVGTLDELLDTVDALMPHIIGSWTPPDTGSADQK